MKYITKTIQLFNLCVPCGCFCKHCLLSYDGKIVGVDYYRGLNYAKGFNHWLKEFHKDINFTYYFGYSMDTKNLIDSIDDLKELNSAMSSFLQLNGIKIRNKNELKDYLLDLKNHGIKLIDLTFYGIKETHDKFAGRKNDYEYLLSILDIANEIGLDTEVSIAITKENLNEIDLLVETLESKASNLFIFIPHCYGRGIELLNSKITIDDYNHLSNTSKKYFNRNNFKTEEEWFKTKLEIKYEKILCLSLLKSNIEDLEKMNYSEIFQELEKMDNDFYSKIPTFELLLKLYHNYSNKCLYSKKDLYALYRKRYIKENKLAIEDIDERYTNSIRI